MKQLHVVGSYPNGMHTFVLWQLRGALDLGHQVTVLAARTGNEQGYLLAQDLGLAKISTIYADYRASSPWRLDLRRFSPSVEGVAGRARYGRILSERRKSFFCKLLAKSEIREIDLIQVHFVNWAIDVGLPLAKLVGRPCVVTAHGAVSTTAVEFLNEVQQRADAVVLVSEQEMQILAERTGSMDKLHRVWNGLPLQTGPAPARDERTRDAPLALASIGRLDPEKRIGDLIEAVALLRKRGHDCTLSVFGEGPLRGVLESRIRQLGLQAQVRLLGNVSHKELMNHLVNADILLHPCEREPFGLAMIEGMSVKLPVVAARSSGALEIVVHEQTGYIYAPGDLEALVHHVMVLARNPTLRFTLGAAGRKRVESEFSMGAHMQRMNKIWCATLDRYPASHDARNTECRGIE